MAEMMQERVSRTASVSGTLYLLLLPIPIVCFLGALITDFVYSRSAEPMWLHFSQWLLAAGLLFGLLAAIALLVEFIANASIRAGIGWAHLIVFYAALIIQFCNALNHAQDGWTAVVPIGLTLSVIGSILALAAVVTLFFMPPVRVAGREVRP